LSYKLGIGLVLKIVSSGFKYFLYFYFNIRGVPKKLYEVKILFDYTDEKLGAKKVVSKRKSTNIYDIEYNFV